MSTERPVTTAEHAATGFGVMVVMAAILAPLFATMHNAQIDDLQAYRDSPLALMTLGSLLCGCGNLLPLAGATVFLLMRKRYKRAGFLVFAGVLMLALGYLAFVLDSETLLHGT